jgi:TolB-like protein/tetratricopeptide (TPR) repeat protein
VGIIGAAVIVAAIALAVFRRPVDRSIAVLPLANLSGDPAIDYLGEGLAEEITTALTKAGLRVIGRGTALTLAKRGLDAQAVGKQLSVASVLGGGVQRDGDRLRITIHLLATSDGSDVWSETYDRPNKEWFDVQDEIARGVASKLRVAFAGKAVGASAAPTETSDPEAHALYLQGLYLWNRRSGEKLRQAIGLFEEATHRDPRYARAYAGIAIADVVLANYADVPYDEWNSKAMAAAQHAVSIDSTIAEAHTGIAEANELRFENGAAEREFTRALSLDSTLAIAHAWYAILLGHVGRFDDAIREAKTARRHDPTLVVQTTYGTQLLNAGRYATADSVLRAVLALDSTFTLGVYFHAITLAEQGHYTEAIPLLERLERDPNLRTSAKLGALAYAYARAGRIADARAALARLPRDTALAATCSVAAAYDALGEHDAAAVVLRQAVSLHDIFLTIESHSGMYDGLRRDPQLAPLFAKIEAP